MNHTFSIGSSRKVDDTSTFTLHILLNFQLSFCITLQSIEKTFHKITQSILIIFLFCLLKSTKNRDLRIGECQDYSSARDASGQMHNLVWSTIRKENGATYCINSYYSIRKDHWTVNIDRWCVENYQWTASGHGREICLLHKWWVMRSRALLIEWTRGLICDHEVTGSYLVCKQFADGLDMGSRWRK